MGDPEVKKLFTDYLPGARLPSRQYLCGSLLKRAVNEIEADRKRDDGTLLRLATMQCDGLKDLSRKHIVAFLYTANREVSITSLYETHD